MLKIHDLTFSFKNRPLFQNLSFDVKAGQLTRVAGANGSGKSTLIALITGLISGATGQINFSGDDDFRTWTSWVAPDANGLIPSLSAADNLRFWLELRGLQPDNSVIQTTLAKWGLTGEWIQSSLPVARFSTGMKRRLALAKLQLESTKLWLLDEPLFGLDDSACAQFKDALRSHLERGGGALVVTHDERLIAGMPAQLIRLGGVS